MGTQNEEYIVEMRHITKRFPGIVANDDVTLQIKKGEIFALLGENGAPRLHFLGNAPGFLLLVCHSASSRMRRTESSQRISVSSIVGSVA